MKLLNYKINFLIALFLFALSSLVLASPCEETFSSEGTVQKENTGQIDSSKRLVQVVNTDRVDSSKGLVQVVNTGRANSSKGIVQRKNTGRTDSNIQRLSNRQRISNSATIEKSGNRLRQAGQRANKRRDNSDRQRSSNTQSSLNSVPVEKSGSELEQAVRTLDYQHRLFQKNHLKKFSVSELKSAFNLIKEIQEKEGQTVDSHIIEQRLGNMIQKKRESIDVGKTIIKAGAILSLAAGTPIVIRDVIVYYISSNLYNSFFMVPFISEPITQGIDWIIELFKGEQIVDAELIEGNEQIEE